MNAFAVGFREGMIKAAKATGASRVSSAERMRFAELHRGSYANAGDGCSLGRDDDGLYVYTHRARSKSYPTVDGIPVGKVRFIASTA